MPKKCQDCPLKVSVSYTVAFILKSCENKITKVDLVFRAYNNLNLTVSIDYLLLT